MSVLRSSASVLDGPCQAAIKARPEAFVPWFLCASILYYQWELSPLSDTLFDKLCKDALKDPRWKAHEHAKFIKPDMLSQGTGYNLPWRKLPGRVWGAAWAMREELEGRACVAPAVRAPP